MMGVLIECAVRSAALVVVVWFVLRLLRVRSARLERTSWLIVLASSLAMPLLTKIGALSAIRVADLDWPQPIQLAALRAPSAGVEWQVVLVWVTLTVAAILCVRHMLGVIRWWRVRSAAVTVSSPLCAAFDVRVTPAVNSPATVFSTILVPEDFEEWTAQVQRAVIAHESTHVGNRDFYVQWAAQLHRCVFWFNPLAWWLARRLSTLSEHISDDAAVEATDERAEYVAVLLQFAGRSAHGEHLLPMASEKTLPLRIERILSGQQISQAGLGRTLLLACLLLPVVAFVAGSWPAAARSSKHEADSVADVVLPRSNPKRPLSQPVYPPASRRLGEHGTVVLRLHVLEDGSVADARIDESSGYPDLDYAAFYESFRWTFEPGTVDGVPSRMWGQFAVTFKLADD